MPQKPSVSTGFKTFRRTPLAIAMGLVLAGGSTLACAAGAPPEPGSAINGNFSVADQNIANSKRSIPRVAADRIGNGVVVWPASDGNGNGVFALSIKRDDGGSAPTQFRVNATSDGAQNTPVVAMDADGDFVVAWTDNEGMGSGNDVYVQRYNSDYTTDGAVIKAATATTDEYAESIAMDAVGDFVVVWTNSTSQVIYMAGYNQGATTATFSKAVAQTSVGAQNLPEVAMDATGDFVVAWQSTTPSNAIDIFARSFKKDGTPYQPTSDITVNTQLPNLQKAPAVAMDGAGDFVVAWTDYPGGSTVSDIDARRFALDGTPQPIDGVTTDVVINTATDGLQQNAAVAMDATGDFVVAWSGLENHLRRYKADGSPYAATGVEVNTHTSGIQRAPAIAMDAGGDMLVVWADDDQNKFMAQAYQRETPIDLRAALNVSPSGTVKPGASLTLTASLDNHQAPVTPSGVAAVDDAITAAWKLRDVVTLPSGVQYKSATCGTGWVCPPTISGQTLTFDYAGALMAATASSNITIAVTAPETKGTALVFKNYVYGIQPDTAIANNTSTVTVNTTPPPSSGSGSSGGSDGSSSSGYWPGGGGAFGWLGFALLGLPFVRRRSKR